LPKTAAPQAQRVNRVSDVKPHFLRDSLEFEIIPEISPRASEALFDKFTMSAIVLRDCGIRSFAIVGIEPTVRHAMDLAYIPVIITDACGPGNQIAADRSRASLATFGGSLQTDTAAIVPLLRQASVRIELSYTHG